MLGMSAVAVPLLTLRNSRATMPGHDRVAGPMVSQRIVRCRLRLPLLSAFALLLAARLMMMLSSLYTSCCSEGTATAVFDG